MGKRELALIFVFVVIGFVVYQLTAPADRSDGERFSFSRLFDEIKRDMQGSRHQTEVRAEASAPAPASILEVELAPFRGKLTIIGEDREDVQAVLVAMVAGSDKVETERRAKEVTPRLTVIGESLRLDIQAPRQAGRLRSELTVRVPERLKVRADVQSGSTEISNVAAAAINSRGELKVEDIRGSLTGEHRDGESSIAHVGSMRLVLRRSDCKIDGIEADSTLEAIDGDLEVSGSSSRLRITGIRSDVTVVEAEADVEIKGTDGRVTVKDARAPVQIEGLRTRIEVRLAKGVPVQVSTTDDGILLVVPPSGGITINAIASDGSIETEIATLAVVREDTAQRATGAVAGGGPTATLRTTRGSITIAPAESSTVEK